MVSPETLLITHKYIREALDQIIQVAPATTTNPLQFLRLVDLHMLTADFTFFQDPRKFAFNDFLISAIHGQYVYQRSLHAFSPVEIGMTLLDASRFIMEDAATGNSDLIGWSWFYFHYAEMSLRISQQQYCQMVNLDERTIRRYQNNVIEQFSNHLIRLEQNARESNRKQTLYSQLPHQGIIFELFEREKELQLVRTSKLKHFYIFGALGIGKTVFVEQIIREQIDHDEVERIVWLQSPETIENIKSYLRERLLSENTKINLAEFVSLRKTTIVIDNAENLQDDLQLEDFLLEFSHATIFLISRLFRPLSGCLQIDLHELSLAAVDSMLSTRKGYASHFNSTEYSRSIWQAIGGNPLAVELLDQNWSIFELQIATSLTLDQVFSNLFDLLTFSERLAWVILALLHAELISAATLSKLESSHITFADFITLKRLCVAGLGNVENPNLSLTVSASRYIQMRYESSIEFQQLLDQFVTELSVNNANVPEINLLLIEAILSFDWVVWNVNSYLDAVRRFWRIGLRHGHYTKWYVILGRIVKELAPKTLDLAIAYGISQRNLGQWIQAHSIFTSIIQYAGMRGLFSYQAEALLELAILLHYQGDYAGTIQALNRIDNFLDKTVTDLQYRVLIERIEIELERNNLNDAKLLVVNLPDHSRHKLVLQLEIYAKDTTYEKDLPFLASLIDKLSLDFSYSPSLMARIHILIGRVYQNISDAKSAIKHLTIAHTVLMDSDNDPFALARTQSNLAVLLTDADQFLNAQELLKSAENIQRKIGDRVGLAVTIHNEHVLDRKIVN